MLFVAARALNVLSWQEFNDYVYRSFIANNKDFCILTVTELPLKRWLRGEGPAWCFNCVVRCELGEVAWCGACWCGSNAPMLVGHWFPREDVSEWVL